MRADVAFGGAAGVARAEPRPATWRAPARRMWIFTEQARLSAYVFDRAAHSPVLLVLPAMGVPAAYYAPFASAMAKCACAVVVVDLRGQGDSRPASERAADFGYADLALDDLPSAIEVVTTWFPGRPLFLCGHSLGGQLAACYVSRPRGDVRGLILTASGSPYYRRFPALTGAALLAGTHAAAFGASLWGHWPGDRLGFGGRQPRKLIAEWARFARTGRCPAMPAERHTDGLPVLAVSLGDDAYATPAAVDELCAQLTGARVTRRHVAVAGREGASSHFRWARCPGPVVGAIGAWLSEREKGLRS